MVMDWLFVIPTMLMIMSLGFDVGIFWVQLVVEDPEGEVVGTDGFVSNGVSGSTPVNPKA
jgi:hypothetical protein